MHALRMHSYIRETRCEHNRTVCQTSPADPNRKDKFLLGERREADARTLLGIGVRISYCREIRKFMHRSMGAAKSMVQDWG